LAPPAAGVLAGLVLRPPRASWNGERYTGPRAAHVDDSALQGLPGIVRVLVARDFVGIVATRPELAQQAAARLPVQWRATPPGADAHPLWQHGRPRGPRHGRRRGAAVARGGPAGARGRQS
uniref:hypothetical protein n=1 Tax=Bordetella pertussis TaxID=520 RepID=UPI000AB17C17